MRENNLYVTHSLHPSQTQHMYKLHRYKSLCKIDNFDILCFL